MLGLALFCAAFVRVLAFGQCDLMEARTLTLTLNPTLPLPLTLTLT